MSHPILPYMPTVFIPVSDLKSSIEWYCGLLEMSVQPSQDGGGIYYFNLEDTDIILDSNIWGYPPMIMFDSPDIDAAYAFCQEQQYAYIGELTRYKRVAYFNVAGNMICQTERSRSSAAAHPLLQRVARVLIHAEHQAESEKWYETFLQKPIESDGWAQVLTGIPMNRGAHLLIDDNRLSQSSKVRYDRLHLDLRANPIAIIESPDIEAARAHVMTKNPSSISEIENRLGLTFFTFCDPDGNGLMVCQSR